MKLIPLTITGVLCLGSVALAQENPDPLRQRLLAQAQSVGPDDYAFTRTVHTAVVAGGNTENTVNVEKYDPTKPRAARWTLVSVNGAAPSADALKKFRKEAAKRRVPGYYRFANYIGSAATASKDEQGRTVLRYSSLPKSSVLFMDSDVSHNAAAEVVVGDENGVPFAEQLRLSVKPMRMKILMHLQRFEITARYRIGPDRKPMLMESTTEMSGSGLGLQGNMKSVATYSDYRAVGGER